MHFGLSGATVCSVITILLHVELLTNYFGQMDVIENMKMNAVDVRDQMIRLVVMD